MASWTTEESSAMDKCGHCDNCTRPVETVLYRDVTLEAWQTLKIVQAVDTEGGRQTVAGLSDLVRGAAGGSFEAGGKRKKSKEKVHLDYNAVAGGKVVLSKDVCRPSAFFFLKIAFADTCSIMSYASSVSERLFFLFLFAIPLLSGTDDDRGWCGTFSRTSNC